MKTFTSILTTLALSLLASHALADSATPRKDAPTPPPAAEAESAPTTLKPFSMSLLAGHGFDAAFRTGFGGRVGYTVANSVYVGGAFAYHAGSREGLVEARAWYVGGELGYDLHTGPLVVRPYVGAGSVSVTASVTMPPIKGYEGTRFTASESRFGFWPGASLLFPFENGSAFVGLDAKFLVVEGASALNTYGTFGLAL